MFTYEEILSNATNNTFFEISNQPHISDKFYQLLTYFKKANCDIHASIKANNEPFQN